jgi:hypothetical protein
MPVGDLPLRTPRLTVTIESFTARRSGALIGLCTVIVPEVRLRIIDVTVFQSRGKRWCGLPGKAILDKDGRARRDDRGKVQYAPVLHFLDRDTSDTFSGRVIEALLEAYPHAFDAEENAQ